MGHFATESCIDLSASHHQHDVYNQTLNSTLGHICPTSPEAIRLGMAKQALAWFGDGPHFSIGLARAHFVPGRFQEHG
jgi:hypothetical protein